MPQIRFITTIFLSLVFVFLSNCCFTYLSAEGSSFSQNLFNRNDTSTQIVDTEAKRFFSRLSYQSQVESAQFNQPLEIILSQRQASQTNRFEFLEGIPLFYLGVIGSLLAGLATGVGAIPVLFVSQVSKRIQGVSLGFAAGVMLAATSFSLLLPSIEAATSKGGSNADAANIVIAGTLLGGIFLWATHRYFPYQRYIKKPQGSNYENLKGIWLFILAIAIHNFPEGLAVGVGFGGGDIGNGVALAIGIGLQNLPEGLAVALALITENYSRVRAFWVALLTGLLEPVGGLVGAGVIALGEALLPWGMSFAAGAMLFVICDRIIPNSQSLGRGKEVTASLMVGFAVMMYLDVSLG